MKKLPILLTLAALASACGKEVSDRASTTAGTHPLEAPEGRESRAARGVSAAVSATDAQAACARYLTWEDARYKVDPNGFKTLDPATGAFVPSSPEPRPSNIEVACDSTTGTGSRKTTNPDGTVEVMDLRVLAANRVGMTLPGANSTMIIAFEDLSPTSFTAEITFEGGAPGFDTEPRDVEGLKTLIDSGILACTVDGGPFSTFDAGEMVRTEENTASRFSSTYSRKDNGLYSVEGRLEMISRHLRASGSIVTCSTGTRVFETNE